MNTEAFARQLPKVDLHCHIAGTLRPATMISLAAKNGVHLPTTDPDRLYDFRDFYHFLDVVRCAARCLVTREDFVRVAYEALVDAADFGNLRYAELFFNPTDYLHTGSYPLVVDGLIEGIEAAQQDRRVTGRLIAAINRELPLGTSLETIREVIVHRRDAVIGIGLDGAESVGPPATFAEVYKIASDAGLHRTAHVCEDNQTLTQAPPSNVTACLDELGCDRLDHGYNVLADAQVTDRCRAEQVPFTVGSHTCVSSRLSTRWQNISRMREEGLCLVIATDDPPMYGIDIGQSYVTLAEQLALTNSEISRLALAGIEATWLDPSDKHTLRQEFVSEINAIAEGLHGESGERLELTDPPDPTSTMTVQ